MKTIRNQLKYPIGVRLPMVLQKELTTAGIQFFMRLQKEQQIDNKQKINWNSHANSDRPFFLNFWKTYHAYFLKYGWSRCLFNLQL